MSGFTRSWPRPFAVGVLALPRTADEDTRTTERLGLALDAYSYGYFLLDTVEIGPGRSEPVDTRGPAHRCQADGRQADGRPADGYAAAEALAARATADAFVTRGPVDHIALSAAASRHRLVVRGGRGVEDRD